MRHFKEMKDGAVTGVMKTSGMPKDDLGYTYAEITEQEYVEFLAAQTTPTIEAIRVAKLAELSAACNAAIVAGVDVTTSYGAEHFSLSDHDQTNITNLSILVGSGAPGYLYHADNKACDMYAAADITSIVTAALQHITYHTTLHNYLKQWVTRETDAQVLSGITYGAELPEDLVSAMAALLAAVSGGGT